MLHAPQRPPSSAFPLLSVFHGDPEDPEGPDLPGNSGPELSPSMTLSAFYARYFGPVYLTAGAARPATKAEYQTAIARWAELTGDPPLQSITPLVCAEFVAADLAHAARRAGTTLSPNTVRKHCTHLQTVLNLAGPVTRDYPQAATEYGLFGDDPFGRPRRVPWFNRPPEREKLPTDGFTLAELRAILAACDVATRPRLAEVSAADWWRSLFRFVYNSAARIGTAIQVRRTWIHRADQAAWLEVPGDHYKGGLPHLINLPPAALRAVEEIPTGERVWPWPHTLKYLHDTRRKILAAAGLPEDRRFGFHGLRKGMATELYRRDRLAAQLQLGHASGKTTERSYANPSVLGPSLAQAIAPACADIPQP